MPHAAADWCVPCSSSSCSPPPSPLPPCLPQWLVAVVPPVQGLPELHVQSAQRRWSGSWSSRAFGYVRASSSSIGGAFQETFSGWPSSKDESLEFSRFFSVTEGMPARHVEIVNATSNLNRAVYLERDSRDPYCQEC